MAITAQQLDQYGVKLFQRSDGSFLYGSGRGTGGINPNFAQQLASSGVPINKIRGDESSDILNQKYGVNFNTSGLATLGSETDIEGRYGAPLRNKQQQASEEQQASQLNNAISQGNATLVEQLKPGYTIWNGAFVQKSQIPQLQAGGATVQGGNVVGPKVPGLGGQPMSPEQKAAIENAQQIEQQIDTSRPSPGSVNAQPFTQGGGAIGAGGGAGTQGGALASKYEQGFQAANASLGGAGGGAGGISGAQGSALVNQYSPTNSNNLASTFVKTDPYIESLVQAWQQYINPQNQRKSLTETYNQMLKDSGIQAIDMELLDMKNVIEGSEEDLRTEITKAGGFATNSQILALTNSRNRQLIKNYNTLLDTRNAKEKYLQTAIQLEQSDRQSADQRFESAFNMGLQIANYRQQMQTNARNQMQWLVSNMGFDGLYDATGGDEFTMGLVENSLGIPRGGLLSAANQVRLAKAQAQQEAQLDLQLKQQQIKTPEERALETQYKQAQIANIQSEIGKRNYEMRDIGGIDEKTMSKIQSSSEYKTISGVLPAMNAIKTYLDAIKDTGSFEWWSGDKAGNLKASYGNALSSWKTLATLGALSGADFGLAENVIPAPSLWKRDSKMISQLTSALDNGIKQGEIMTKRLSQNYPNASGLLNQQLDDMRVTAYPDKFVYGDDGLVYELE